MSGSAYTSSGIPVPAPRSRAIPISTQSNRSAYENVAIRPMPKRPGDAAISAACNNLDGTNVNKPTASKAIALPNPAQRLEDDALPQDRQELQQAIYESNEHADNARALIALPTKSAINLHHQQNRPTPALNYVLPVPVKTPRRAKRPSGNVVTSGSPTSLQMSTSSGVLVDAAEPDSPSYLQRSSRLNRSNASLNSTTSSGGSAGSSMTNDVLKAISERTTLKFDQVQAYSRDVLAETKSKLYSLSSTLQCKSMDHIQKARIAIGNRIIGSPTVQIDDGRSQIDGVRQSATGSCDISERQTAEPASREMLKIHFDSPMSSTTGTYRVLSEQSYDAPRNAGARSVQSGNGSTLPPSYEQVFPQDNGVYGRLRPAPAAPVRKPVAVSSGESFYTEMSPVLPASKSAGDGARKRSDYEETEIRFKPKTLDCSSTRATFDSNDVGDLARSTVDSLNIQSAVAAAERQLPSPARSESWRYHDSIASGGGGDDDDDEDDDDEPTYINVHGGMVSVGLQLSDGDCDATYGSVYARDDCQNVEPMPPTLFTPTSTLTHRRPNELTPVRQQQLVGQPTHCSADDLLHEFDPLSGGLCNVDNVARGDSNERLLIDPEILTTCDGKHAQTPTAAQSASAMAAPMPTQQYSMHARALENEEDIIRPFLSQIDKGPLGKADAKKANWFTHSETACASSIIANSAMNFKSFEPPPPYSEKAAASGAAWAPSGEDDSAPASAASLSSRSRFPWFGKGKSSDNANTDDTAPAAIDVPVVPKICARPPLPLALHRYDGYVIRLPYKSSSTAGDEGSVPNAFIEDGRFQVFDDGKNAKDSIPLVHIKSVQSRELCGSEHSVLTMHCFEIVVLTPTSRSAERLSRALASGDTQLMKMGSAKFVRSKFVYGALNEADRDIWLQKLLVSLTDRMPPKATCRYYRAGWCYMRLSVTGRWSSAWCVLQKHKRRLYCYTTEGMNVDVLDLRKARCMKLIEDGQSADCWSRVFGEKGPMLMLDCPPYAVYIMMATRDETNIWHDIIREVSHHNGPMLHEQQLTANDVPVIVQKCVDFINWCGSTSEGIYRLSASNQDVKALLREFRHDAFQVTLTREGHTEHLVANVLKRFLRELPENLLGRHVASFESITQMSNTADKRIAYRNLIERLPLIEQRTLRTIIGHLYMINRLTSKNKMSTENLAIAWGPSLLDNNEFLPSDEQEIPFSDTKGDIMVFLIQHYRSLYALTDVQIDLENRIVDKLLFPHTTSGVASAYYKQSGDLKVYVQICKVAEAAGGDSTDAASEEPVHISLGPAKTAYQVCCEVAHRFPGVPPSGLTMFECIQDVDLRRPLHHTERPLDVVLRWSCLSVSDCKDNELQVKPRRFLNDIARWLRSVSVVAPPQHMLYADTRSRTLQKYVLELTECKLLVRRSEKSKSVVRELELRSVTVYLGAEKKRNLTDCWSLTLVENNPNNGTQKKKRDSTYIGHVIAGKRKQDMYEWFASIWYSIYGDSVLPDEEIVQL